MYMTFGVIIEELCPSPLLILCVVPIGTYLDDDEDIGILVELAFCFCKSESYGFVINKVFEKLNNVVKTVQYSIELKISLLCL